MKFKKIFFGLLITFIGIVNINAMTLKPTGTTKASRGENITIYITLNRSSSEAIISGLDGIVSWDTTILTLVSQEKMLSDKYTVFATVSNGKKFSYGNLLYDDLIAVTSKNIVKLIFKVNANASFANTGITVTKQSATDDEGNSVNISGGTHTVNILSDVNTLSSLTINGDLISGFTSEKTSYNASFSSSTNSVIIAGTTTDPSATISGSTGTKTLEYGMNVFKVTVAGASGLKKIYTLNLTREDNRSKVNTLKTLSLSDITIDFNSNTNNYNATVYNEIEATTITSTLADSKSRYVSNYGNREVSLKEGLNKILIKVEAENKSINTYTLNVTRASADEVLSNNTNIVELKILNYEVDFKNDVFDYSLKIAEEEKLDIDITLEDVKTNYTIVGNESLGNNSEITISVIAEDGTKKDYKIKILKDKKQEKEQDLLEEPSNEENNLYVIILEILVLAQFSLIVLLVFLLKKKKYKKKAKVNEEEK